MTQRFNLESKSQISVKAADIIELLKAYQLQKNCLTKDLPPFIKSLTAFCDKFKNPQQVLTPKEVLELIGIIGTITNVKPKLMKHVEKLKNAIGSQLVLLIGNQFINLTDSQLNLIFEHPRYLDILQFYVTHLNKISWYPRVTALLLQRGLHNLESISGSLVDSVYFLLTNNIYSENSLAHDICDLIERKYNLIISIADFYKNLRDNNAHYISLKDLPPHNIEDLFEYTVKNNPNIVETIQALMTSIYKIFPSHCVRDDKTVNVFSLSEAIVNGFKKTEHELVLQQFQEITKSLPNLSSVYQTKLLSELWFTLSRTRTRTIEDLQTQTKQIVAAANEIKFNISQYTDLPAALVSSPEYAMDIVKGLTILDKKTMPQYTRKKIGEYVTQDSKFAMNIAHCISEFKNVEKLIDGNQYFLFIISEIAKIPNAIAICKELNIILEHKDVLKMNLDDILIFAKNNPTLCHKMSSVLLELKDTSYLKKPKFLEIFKLILQNVNSLSIAKALNKLDTKIIVINQHGKRECYDEFVLDEKRIEKAEYIVDTLELLMKSYCLQSNDAKNILFICAKSINASTLAKTKRLFDLQKLDLNNFKKIFDEPEQAPLVSQLGLLAASSPPPYAEASQPANEPLPPSYNQFLESERVKAAR